MFNRDEEQIAAVMRRLLRTADETPRPHRRGLLGALQSSRHRDLALTPALTGGELPLD
jgi:hypothetical protein